MGFADMDKADKVKLSVAVGVLVVAIGVIGWYFMGSKEPAEKPVDPNSQGAPINAAEGKGKPAGNRRAVPGADK
ncbi:MAG: hypothetical protein IT432_03550 [Phycisphaerales bacterium]|nr:hypothetical protein [Phycisphaerales bacterium]